MNTRTNQTTARTTQSTKRRPAHLVTQDQQTAAPDDSADQPAVKLPYCIGFEPGDLALLTRTLRDGNLPDGPRPRFHPGKLAAPRVGVVLEIRFSGEFVKVDFGSRIVWVSAAALELVSFMSAEERFALEDEIATNRRIAAALNGDGESTPPLCRQCGKPTDGLDLCETCIDLKWDRKCAADEATALESLDPGVL